MTGRAPGESDVALRTRPRLGVSRLGAHLNQPYAIEVTETAASWPSRFAGG
jgi:hypothetical protein